MHHRTGSPPVPPRHGRRARTLAATLAIVLAAAGTAIACGDDADDDEPRTDGAGAAPTTDGTTTTTAEQAAMPICEDTRLVEREVIVCTADDGGGDAADQGLVVALHGRGSSPDEMRATTELDRYAAEEGLAVVYPSGLDGGWGDDTFPTPSRPTGVEDVRYLDDLIEALRSQPAIDDRPVGIVGFSNGASMALRYAGERPDDVRAVVAVAGQLPRDPSVRPTEPVPLLEIYGTADPLRGYGTGIADPPDRRPGQPTPTLSAPDTVAAFVDALSTSSHEGPAESDPDPTDGTRLRTERWTDDAGTTVVFHTIVDGGHTWPSGHAPQPEDFGAVSTDVDASAEAISFVFEAMAGA